MKRKIVFVICVILIFGFVSLDSFAQSANREQQLIGTWVSEGYEFKITMTFNRDGTMVISDEYDSERGRWGAAENKIIFVIDSDYSEYGEFYISSDGQTLILLIDGEAILFRRGR